MQNETCPYEYVVLKACRTGEWDPDLLKHYQTCHTCHEAERTAAWVRAAALGDAAFPLPDPDLLWIRTSVAAREQEESRVLWLETFRRTLALSPLCAAMAALVLEAMKTAGIGEDRWLQAVSGTFGMIPLGAAGLVAALVYLAPSLFERFRAFRPF
jgi:hypothetical protein